MSISVQCPVFGRNAEQKFTHKIDQFTLGHINELSDRTKLFD